MSRLLSVFLLLPLPSHMIDSFERKIYVFRTYYATSTGWGQFDVLQLGFFVVSPIPQPNLSITENLSREKCDYSVPPRHSSVV